MSKKVLFYSLFFIALIIGFYFLLVRLIPDYGKVGRPTINKVQDFAFRNQNGLLVTNKDVEGKVYVSEFFFTTCPGICTKLNTNLRPVYEKYKNEPNFRILSHTVNPGTDSVGRLKHYADSLGVDASHWIFLTGTKDSLYMAARLSYMLDDPKNSASPIDEQFIHTQFFAVVDKHGNVRSIVDGLKKDEIASMEKEIDELLKEN